MVIRKQHLSTWSRTLHGGRHKGAAELAACTRIDMELASWRGLFTLLALLDCSKCYERVAHALAGQRAVDAGFPDTILNLIFNMYSGPRRLRAHGAISNTTTGHHGLIAGCSFAKDLLKAFLRTAATLPMHATFRDYVDDMTLLSTGATPDEAAMRLQESLDIVKAQLIQDNMCLNDDKQQIYGNTQAVRDAWNERNSVPAVDTAKDLGVHHYGYLHRHPVLDAKLTQFASTAKRISFVPTSRDRRASLAGAIIFGRCLYGHESHYITQRHFQQMRQHMRTSMGAPRGQRNGALYLLTHQNGRHNPEMVRARRLLTFWQKLLLTHPPPEDYWRHCRPGGERDPSNSSAPSFATTTSSLTHPPSG